MEPNPEMLWEELSFNELALLNGESLTEPRVRRVERGQNGEYVSPKETAMVAEAIVGES